MRNLVIYLPEEGGNDNPRQKEISENHEESDIQYVLDIV